MALDVSCLHDIVVVKEMRTPRALLPFCGKNCLTINVQSLCRTDTDKLKLQFHAKMGAIGGLALSMRLGAMIAFDKASNEVIGLQSDCSETGNHFYLREILKLN